MYEVRRTFIHAPEESVDEPCVVEGGAGLVRSKSDSSINYGCCDQVNSSSSIATGSGRSSSGGGSTNGGSSPRPELLEDHGLSAGCLASTSSSTHSGGSKASSVGGDLSGGGRHHAVESELFQRPPGVWNAPPLGGDTLFGEASLSLFPFAAVRLAVEAGDLCNLGVSAAAAATAPAAGDDTSAAAWRLEQAAVALEAAARQARAAAKTVLCRTKASDHCQNPQAVRSRCAGLAPKSHTTLMLRNLPNNYSRDMLLELLDKEGFHGFYDFVYYPVDFKRWAGLGYAFVNFAKHDMALQAWEHFEGFARWDLPSSKVIRVCWGSPLQGLAACTDRYRNSAVMHEDVPDYFKPVVFNDGRRVAFPAPTKSIRNPRWRHK